MLLLWALILYYVKQNIDLVFILLQNRKWTLTWSALGPVYVKRHRQCRVIENYENK